jgi:hypothetical protein
MKSKFPLVLALLCAAAAPALAQQMGAAPQPEHQALSVLAGNWKGSMTLQLPGMEPMKGELTRSARLDMNGLWLISDYEGTMMGAPFRGHSIWGFDPAKKKQVEVWVDSFRSSVSQIEGDYDPSQQTWTKWTDGVHPVTGQKVRERHTVALKPDGTFFMELAAPGSNGDYLPFMQVTMTKTP